MLFPVLIVSLLIDKSWRQATDCQLAFLAGELVVKVEAAAPASDWNQFQKVCDGVEGIVDCTALPKLVELSWKKVSWQMWINSETASLTREQNWEKRLENVKQKRDQVSNRCLARIVISATELFLEGGTIVWSWTIIPKCISSLVSRSRTKTLWVRLLWQQVELLSCKLRQLQTCESSFSCLGTQVTILSDCCVTALWHWAGWKLKKNTAPIEVKQPEELSKVNLHQQKTRVWRISWLVLLVSGVCSGSRVVAGAAPGETRARPWSRTTPPVHSTHPRVDCHAAVMIRGTSAYHWRRLEVAGWEAPARTHAKLFVLATSQYNA